MKHTIETERLRIIPFSESFLTSRYVNWLNDSEIMRFSEQRHRAHTLETCKLYFESYAGTPNFFWAITEKDPELGHIGNMNAYVDTNNSLADVGILIGEKKVWGKGYGSEAWIAVCNYLLKELVIRKVTAGALSNNLPMIRIMRHAGMIEDGRRRRHYLFEGEEVDVEYAALFRDGYEKT